MSFEVIENILSKFTSTPIILVTVSTVCYCFYRYRYGRVWARQNIDGPFSLPLMGSMWRLIGVSMAEADTVCFKKYGPIFGTYEGTVPKLFISDTDLIRQIFVKDAHIFVDRTPLQFNQPYFRKILSILNGERWKKARKLITPTFTSGKIKRVYPIMNDCVKSVENYLEKQIILKKKIIDVKNLSSKFTLQVIAKCCFAISIEIADDDKDNEFLINVHKFMTITLRAALTFLILPTKVIKFFDFHIVPDETVQFFVSVVRQIIEQRKDSIGKHNDFLDLLFEARKDFEENQSREKNNNSDEELIDEEFMIAQSLLFLVAGNETTSNLLSFAIYLLAINENIQDRLYEEISQAANVNEFDYENLQTLEYLDAVVNEVLRYYPPLQRIERLASADYWLEERSILIPKNATVNFCTYSLHRDERYYEEPDKFNPDRFLRGNKSSINQYAFLPFGVGPRNCAGSRFALVEVKLAIAKILLKYRFYQVEKTAVPMKLAKGTAFTSPEDVTVGVDYRNQTDL